MSRTIFSHRSAITAPLPIVGACGLEESHLGRNKKVFTSPAKEFELQKDATNFLDCYFILWFGICFTKTVFNSAH